jgi:hypothetical protein
VKVYVILLLSLFSAPVEVFFLSLLQDVRIDSGKECLRQW